MPKRQRERARKEKQEQKEQRRGEREAERQKRAREGAKTETLRELFLDRNLVRLSTCPKISLPKNRVAPAMRGTDIGTSFSRGRGRRLAVNLQTGF